MDESGCLASVEITLSPRWRQAHGIETRAKLVETVMYGRVTPRYPDGSGTYIPGFELFLNVEEMVALQDPDRATFVNIYGHVIEVPLHGGHA